MIGQKLEQIAIIGFGEVGAVFAQDLVAAGLQVSVFDKLICALSSRDTMLARARAANVCPLNCMADAVRDKQLIISTVTASAAVSVASEAAPLIHRGQVLLDMNSVSPKVKAEIAEIIQASGADFVEAAVMAPVRPQRIKVPILLGGALASDLAPRLNSIGMNVSVAGDRIGVASAIKMCRSVVMKGLEALAVECLFAARHYGVEDAVLASLAASYPQMGWGEDRPDYLVSRVAQHGRRRAAELRDVAETLRDVGLDPFMAIAAADRQEWLANQMAEQQIEYVVNERFSWRALADVIEGRKVSDSCEAS